MIVATASCMLNDATTHLPCAPVMWMPCTVPCCRPGPALVDRLSSCPRARSRPSPAQPHLRRFPAQPHPRPSPAPAPPWRWFIACCLPALPSTSPRMSAPLAPQPMGQPPPRRHRSGLRPMPLPCLLGNVQAHLCQALQQAGPYRGGAGQARGGSSHADGAACLWPPYSSLCSGSGPPSGVLPCCLRQ